MSNRELGKAPSPFAYLFPATGRTAQAGKATEAAKRAQFPRAAEAQSKPPSSPFAHLAGSPEQRRQLADWQAGVRASETPAPKPRERALTGAEIILAADKRRRGERA